VRGVVGLHASFTVSDDTIREAGLLCREHGTVLHVHVAEDRHDVDDARRRGYDGVVHRLRALGALLPGSILAHGVHLTRNEVREVDGLGCWLVQNPRSNHHNQVGFATVLDQAARVALGTDGFPADMPTELRALADTAPAGDDRARDGSRTARLDNGWKLVTNLFPDLDAPDRGRGGPRHFEVGRASLPVSGVPDTVFDSVVEEARREAARLWKRIP
jgi:cytosine/adenosine deaminase-related metal-dependent hydrolase